MNQRDTMSPANPAAARQSPPERKVGIGELAVLEKTGLLRTLLGSCVGLMLFDPARRVGGLAHIVLPASNGDSQAPGKFADTALPALIQMMKAAGAQPKSIVAKLAGGANMFGTSAKTIGDQNVEIMESLLARAGLDLIGKDCGGSHGRRVTFDVETGLATIEWAGGSSNIL